MKKWAVAGLVALAGASVLAPALASGQAASAQATRLSVSGHVACAYGQPVRGLWVASSGGGSNFARWRRTSRSSARYADWLATSLPTAISLHVGCGSSAGGVASGDWTPAVVTVTTSTTINATGCGGSYCTFPSADSAASWAENHLTVRGGGDQALAGDKVTDSRAYASWAGLGVAFTLSAYLNAAHIWPRPGVNEPIVTANAVYRLYASELLVQNTWETSTGSDPLPPRGALVFYPSPASGGQMAISAGGGWVISANSSRSPLVREQRYNSISGYEGWAFPINMPDGSSGALPKPAAVPPSSRTAAASPPARRGVAGATDPHRPGSLPAGLLPAWTGDVWLSRALSACLALLVLFGIVLAVRARRMTRRPDRRHGHRGARVAGGEVKPPVLSSRSAAEAPDPVAPIRRARAPLTYPATATAAAVSRTLLYANARARALFSRAFGKAGAARAQTGPREHDGQQQSRREGAVKADAALKEAEAEIHAQRRRIAILLAQVRGLQQELGPQTMRRITTENTALSRRVRQLTGDNRTLEERLEAARANAQLADRRIAQLEAELSEHATDPLTRPRSFAARADGSGNPAAT